MSVRPSNFNPLRFGLSQVARHGLACADESLVESVALAVWYGMDVPEVSDLQGSHSDEALRLVERLTYYSVASQSRKKQLLAAVRAFRAQQQMELTEEDQSFNREFLRFLPRLQPLQTRHFAETMTA